ncbi:MAG: bifunctional folylpolyglutamate synthase/dihydrofolate synthase [Elusimicrobia bacterium]|nr:bifunctional folylpolyglutamate synthase/dihydrofolate synthase [Elusimicrobiota bacterium]
MTYAAALRVLNRRHESRIRLGLSRVRRVLRRLGDPHEGPPAIHVAGTNGKGSTCAILESVLREAGCRTGLYLSPHLSSVRERIQVSGRMIPERDFARLLGRVLAAEGRDRLTYFELLTCVAFLHFQEREVATAVLETGLGGRLDATNVVSRPLACVITSLSFDHMQWLGKTLPRIAEEKAGIIKPGVPVFCPALPRPALEVVSRRARALGAPLRVVRPLGELATAGLPLIGCRQRGNAALAKAVLERVMPSSLRAWRRGLASVRLRGRCEIIHRGGKTALVDGAHNPEAAEALARTWRGLRLGRARWIVGIMKDKDRAGVVGRLAPLIGDAVAVAPRHPRALPAARRAEEIRRQAPAAAVRTAPKTGAALRRWLKDPAAPRTAVVCGSFYLAAEALRALQGGGHV